MDVVLFGPAGAGKGTQARFLTEKLGIPQISTGELMRAERKSGSELGTRFDSFMTQGKLVPDELTVELLERRVRQDDAKNGAIFDGFPRTVAQAKALDVLLGKLGRRVDRVIALEVPEDAIVDRITGRRSCEACGHIYHVRYNAPPPSGKCVTCGSERIVQRDDDREEKVRRRNAEYLEHTLPILDHYQAVVVRIEGMGPVEEVTHRIDAALGVQDLGV